MSPTTQAHKKPFEYQLLETQTTFRLLNLHRGFGSQNLECSIQHHDLSSPVSFRALSYTWGQDAPRYDIYVPSSGSVIRVRENLRNALRSLRRKDSECLLWIDAICINQASNEERNHQVQLMNRIYGNANGVVVWLESAGERARDVAKAFKFVQAAAKYGDTSSSSGTANSIWHYCRRHTKENDRNWRMLQSLCALRYWTRKWIIQELLTAQSVVLRSGNAQCPMMDFEKFCGELDQNKDNDAYKTLSSWGSSVPHITRSPAALLALQRSAERSSPTTRWLYELVERYSTNQCQQPEDHVYALWSLVGDHKSHLSIDYNESPMQRMVAVVRFVSTHEPIPPAKILEFAFLLVRLFQISPQQLQSEHRLSERLKLVVPTTVLGTVLSPQEPETSTPIALRNTIHPLQPMPIYSFSTLRDLWVLTDRHLPAAGEVPVGRDDMTFFRIARTELYGLATCRLEAGDAIWHFPTTHLVFIVREDVSNRRASILGRAFLVAPDDNGRLGHWKPDDDSVGRPAEKNLSLTLAMLLELGLLASSGGTSLTSSNGATTVVKPPAVHRKIDWDWIYDVEISFKDNRRQKIVTFVSVILFALLLAIVLLQSLQP